MGVGIGVGVGEGEGELLLRTLLNSLTAIFQCFFFGGRGCKTATKIFYFFLSLLLIIIYNL